MRLLAHQGYAPKSRVDQWAAELARGRSRAGTYALLCFMPDPSGTPHVMLGMVEIVVIA